MGKIMEKRTLFTLYFSIVAAILGLSIISPLLPTIAEDLGATGFWVGMIFSGYAISRAIIMPVMGGLSDKYGIIAVANILNLFTLHIGFTACPPSQSQNQPVFRLPCPAPPDP
nr:hypothetical protein BSM_14550 [uncultured archaeon]